MIKSNRPLKALTIICTLTFCMVVQRSVYAQSSTPVFTLIDQKGDTISQKGDANGSLLSSVTVTAGEGFKIKSVITVLARGNARVATMVSKTGVITLAAYRSQEKSGDRLLITIEKVATVVDGKETGIIDTDKTIVIPIK